MAERLTDHIKLATAQIESCGELLVQYKFLKFGIDSSRMTTDSGVDLVAFSAEAQRAVTVQVKTNHRAKPGGGKGRLALDWWLRENSPAELVALADLESECVWLFKHADVGLHAQQQSQGRYHLYMYNDPDYHPRSPMCHVRDFESYILENQAKILLGG